MRTVFIFTISLLLCACDSVFQSTVSSKEEQGAERSASAELRIVHPGGNSRQVIVPDYSNLILNITEYEISLKKSSDLTGTAETYTVLPSGEDTTSAFVAVETGVEYVISVSAKGTDDAGTEGVVASGEVTHTFSETNKRVTVQIVPVCTGNTQKGSFSIPITFPSCGKKFTVKITTDLFSKTYDDVDCTSGAAEILFDDTNIPCGEHSVEITVKTVETDSADSITTKFTYTLLIYAGNTSNIFDTSKGKKSSIDFSESDLLPTRIQDYVFYVLGTGSSLGTDAKAAAQKLGAKAAKQFATVQEAVDKAVSIDANGTYRRTIYIDGAVKETAPASSSDVVRIGNGTDTPKILLKGYGTSPSLERAESSSKAGVLYVAENADVEIEDLSIKNGNRPESGDITVISGGGICNMGTLSAKNVSVSGCQAKNGGGIYTAGTEFTMTGGSVENNNSLTSGGGIYAPENAKLTLSDVNVSGNTASTGNGGGIVAYGNKGGGTYTDMYISGVTVTKNTATGKINSTGGGVFVPTGKYFSIVGCDVSGNVVIDSGNTQKNDVCVNGTLYLYGETFAEEIFKPQNMTISVSPDIALRPGKDTCATISSESYAEGDAVLSPLTAGGTMTQNMADLFKIKDPIF